MVVWGFGRDACDSLFIGFVTTKTTAHDYNVLVSECSSYSLAIATVVTVLQQRVLMVSIH